MIDIAIIGSGMTGLSCSRVLARAGRRVVLFDKGRGLGGRMATRRTDGHQFDHGAQVLDAEGTGFSALLRELVAAGAVASWSALGAGGGFVGAPGMSSLAKAMAEGLDVRQGVQVSAIRSVEDGWEIHADADTHRAAHVVVTVPAPQVAGLIGADHALMPSLSDVRYAPCLTLMAAIDAPAPFVSRNDPDDPLAWIACDTTKPGRPAGGALAWVAQAGGAFSAAHIEEDPTEISRRMLPLLLDRLGASQVRVLHASAHRWRYASVVAPLGRPFLRDRTGTLHLGGDWCLGPRVEDAWTSGIAIARDILERRP